MDIPGVFRNSKKKPVVEYYKTFSSFAKLVIVLYSTDEFGYKTWLFWVTSVDKEIYAFRLFKLLWKKRHMTFGGAQNFGGLDVFTSRDVVITFSPFYQVYKWSTYPIFLICQSHQEWTQSIQANLQAQSSLGSGSSRPEGERRTFPGVCQWISFPCSFHTAPRAPGSN